MTEFNDRFLKVCGKLVKLGEDREELKFWGKIFDDLDSARQQELIGLLEDELKKLESLK